MAVLCRIVWLEVISSEHQAIYSEHDNRWKDYETTHNERTEIAHFSDGQFVLVICPEWRKYATGYYIMLHMRNYVYTVQIMVDGENQY